MPDDLCSALYEDATGDGVPVAFFTDHYCPNCASLDRKLDAHEGISVTRHELPILGAPSVTAARAALAAARQDARDAFHHRMRRATFFPTPAYLRDVAEGLDLDPERFLSDMTGPDVEATLRREMSLAEALGFGAVPVTVIGRTVVVGDVPERTLSRVVDAERDSGNPCPLL